VDFGAKSEVDRADILRCVANGAHSENDISKYTPDLSRGNIHNWLKVFSATGLIGPKFQLTELGKKIMERLVVPLSNAPAGRLRFEGLFPEFEQGAPWPTEYEAAKSAKVIERRQFVDEKGRLAIYVQLDPELPAIFPVLREEFIEYFPRLFALANRRLVQEILCNMAERRVRRQQGIFNLMRDYARINF
jgi:hypothetical protein